MIYLHVQFKEISIKNGKYKIDMYKNFILKNKYNIEEMIYVCKKYKKCIKQVSKISHTTSF